MDVFLCRLCLFCCRVEVDDMLFVDECSSYEHHHHYHSQGQISVCVCVCLYMCVCVCA